MNVRKLMARLNVATVRFDTGRGGIPEFTTQDVAASLAYVRDELAREVFCAIWAPELARLARGDILAKLREAVLTEYAHRARSLEVARLEMHIAECNAAAKIAITIADRKILSGLRYQLDYAKSRHWPGEPAVYARICSSVMAELANGGAMCEGCEGRGTARRGNLSVICLGCNGSGRNKALDVMRARWIGKLRTYADNDGAERNDASGYKRTWAPVYEWVYDLASSAERRAAGKVEAALSRDDVGEAA